MRLAGIISALGCVLLYVGALPTHDFHKRTLFAIDLGDRGQDTSYQTCLNKGTQILQKISASTSDTVGITAKYNELYAPFSHQTPFNTKKGSGSEIAGFLGGRVSLVQVTVGRPNQVIAYKNYFDVTKGIIVAADNFNNKFFYDPANPTSGNPPRTTENSVQWNNIIAEQYKALALTEGSLSTISHILQYEIVNADTNNVIEQAVASALPKQGDWTVVTQGGTGDEMFKALLGTDNGQGAGYLLKDYRTSMSRKSIQAIRVQMIAEAGMMIIDFT
ncbi:hypothetical protein C8R47DRAFT_1074222 [Mycena vitilis]|nr:hypothetical protein C8R47DRAFT_1074222 [Mycena vitilis]